MLTGTAKVMLIFMHLVLCGLFVLFAFGLFAEQWWIPNIFGIVIIGVAMYVLFLIGCLLVMQYFDEEGEFYRYDDEEEESQ